MEKKNLIHLDLTLQEFSRIDHSNLLDYIKQVSEWSEATRQTRAGAYCSLTGFLQRKTRGFVKKAIPERNGGRSTKTFYRIREKVKTEAITQVQWLRFFDALMQGRNNGANLRDLLIAKMLLHGGKRKEEVLGVTIERIDWEIRQITFDQSKSGTIERTTIITFPQGYMESLRQYIGERREGLIFVSKYGERLDPSYLNRKFKKAGKAAGVPTPVTPHVLRTSYVTYLRQLGYKDSEISKVTGQSAAMIQMYDKSSQADNPSQKIELF